MSAASNNSLSKAQELVLELEEGHSTLAEIQHRIQIDPTHLGMWTLLAEAKHVLQQFTKSGMG